MSHTKIYVFLAADRNFARYLPTVVNSVQRTTDAEVEFGIVIDGLNLSEQERLFESVSPRPSVRFFEGSSIIPKGLSHKFILSPMSYARLYMADLVDWEKFVYLDVDTLVLKDLAELYSMDLSDSPGAAVFERSSLNSGVMVINSRKWREDRLSHALTDYAHRHRPKNGDQDAINDLLGESFVRLEWKWNFQIDPLWGRVPLLTKDFGSNASILHFIKGFKPWNLGIFLMPKHIKRLWRDNYVPSGLSRVWKNEARVFIWQMAMLARDWRLLVGKPEEDPK